MMKWLVVLFLFLSFPTFAQTAATVTNSSTQLVASRHRVSLSICNEDASANISICLANTTGSCTAILNTAGQYTIGSGQCLRWDPSDGIPQTAIYGISSVASSPATIWQR